MEAFALQTRQTIKEAFELGPVSLNQRSLAIPLYHCGAKLHLNRTLDLQIDDWKKIKLLMDSHPA